MALITNIRKLHGAGVLADRTALSPSLQFLRYNLIYGYNGSGKSTLSRILACLQTGVPGQHLPEECTFEIQFDDGMHLSCPDKLSGTENRLLAFNSDFVEHNLQWSKGHANPVFYIGQQQAEAAATLGTKKTELQAALASQVSAEIDARAAEKQLATLKRDFAKEVAGRMRLRGRKYEANHWANDFEKEEFGENTILTPDKLEAAEDVCRLEEPMPKIELVNFAFEDLTSLVERTRDIAQKTISTVVISELEKHPLMVKWIKDGQDYHTKNELERCLFCGNPISAERKELLRKALDDSLNRHLENIEELCQFMIGEVDRLRELDNLLPAADTLGAELRPEYREIRAKFVARKEEVKGVLSRCMSIATDKRAKPTLAIDADVLPASGEVSDIAAQFLVQLDEINRVLKTHNEQFDDFANRQEKARLTIRKHFLATNGDEYRFALNDSSAKKKGEETAQELVSQLNSDIATLEKQVRQHGPAAEKINQLIQAYLGHRELSIEPIEDGYQIQRHGKPIEGLPSEGEKTAIAIAYFLSILDADGRKLSDLVVVIDDPISSLDSKALNFAASILRSRLQSAAQVFVLTHNHNFMNEFKKFWKNKEDPKDGKEKTASFYFLDVATKEGGDRASTLVDMPRLLREYDSEYHFLFHYVLAFDDKGRDYEYAYMLPNVLRRVLDVFLAFRCPGSAGLASKIEQLCANHKELDKDRMAALERLSQVESHSDNIDDLISFSSMTLEETAGATKALIAMMDKVDAEHLKGLRRLCR